MGRFLQTDPIGARDDMNLYAYVGGDPLNAVDPMGLEREDTNGGNGGDTDTDKEKNKQAGPSLGCKRAGGGCQTSIMSLGNANKNFKLKMQVEAAITENRDALENMAENGETNADKKDGAQTLRTFDQTVFRFDDNEQADGSCPTACASYLDGKVTFRASQDLQDAAGGILTAEYGVYGLRDVVAHEIGHLRPENYKAQIADLSDPGKKSAEHDANQWMIRVRRYYRD